MDCECDQKINTVVCSLSSKAGHFKAAPIDAKKAATDDKAAKFKQPNATQQAGAEQLLLPAATGLTPFGKHVQARNMLDLEEELLFHDIPIDEIPKTMTKRKKMLQDLELQRLLEAGMEQQAASEQSKKHFMKESEVVFLLAD